MIQMIGSMVERWEWAIPGAVAVSTVVGAGLGALIVWLVDRLDQPFDIERPKYTGLYAPSPEHRDAYGVKR